jgi:hypothetical protein
MIVMVECLLGICELHVVLSTYSCYCFFGRIDSTFLNCVLTTPMVFIWFPFLYYIIQVRNVRIDRLWRNVREFPRNRIQG